MAWFVIDHVSIFESMTNLPARYMERVLLCGRCDRSSISEKLVEDTFHNSFKSVMDRLNRLDMTCVPVKRVYGKRSRSRDRDRDNQIERLKCKIGESHDNAKRTIHPPKNKETD